MEQCHQVFYGYGECSRKMNCHWEVSQLILLRICLTLLAVQCAVHVPMPTLL